jgi:plastocyanin
MSRPGKEMSMRAWCLRVGMGLTAMVVLVPACGGGKASTEESTGGTIEVGSEAANDHGKEDLSGMSTFQLGMGDVGPAEFPFFSPTVLTGTPGQKVKLTLVNNGATPHNFTLVDQGIDQDVDVGGEGSVVVTFPQSGFLEFHCKFHSAQGMLGELKVA